MEDLIVSDHNGWRDEVSKGWTESEVGFQGWGARKDAEEGGQEGRKRTFLPDESCESFDSHLEELVGGGLG